MSRAIVVFLISGAIFMVISTWISGIICGTGYSPPGSIVWALYASWMLGGWYVCFYLVEWLNERRTLYKRNQGRRRG